MTSGVATEINISFAAPDRIQQNQEAVIQFLKSSNNIDFFQAIRTIQAAETNLSTPAKLLHWDAPRTDYKESLADIMDLRSFPDDWEINPGLTPLLEKCFHQAKELITTKLPKTGASIDKLIFSYLFARRNGYEGGSTSSRIGMIWLAPTEHWSMDLWAENIIHEFIHNALFLEDMIYRIFPYGADVMAEPDALATSAIRKIKRGYDKSFHSAFVSLGIINFYQSIGKPFKAEKYIVPLIHCVEDLTKNENYLSPHGVSLLGELAYKVLQLPELISDSTSLMESTLT